MKKVLLVACLSLTLLLPAAFGQTAQPGPKAAAAAPAAKPAPKAAATKPAEPGAPAKYLQAYYLEKEKGDYAGAARLYEAVVAAKTTPAEWLAVARERLAACKEEVAVTDLAALMPPSPMAYLEIVRPGEHLRGLLDQLGLLAGKEAPAEGAPPRLALDPKLVEGLVGAKGVALAVTSLDPETMRPSGVLVFHPTHMDFLKSLAETLLPMAPVKVQTLRGYKVYAMQGVFFALTERLIVLGTCPTEIEAVLTRLQTPGAPSLATDPKMADLLKGRREGLLFAYVSLKPFLPMIGQGLDAMAKSNPQMGMFVPMLDAKSLNALSGLINLDKEGLRTNLSLRLDAGHQNQFFNFLHRAPLDRDALRVVPEGAVALLAISLKERPAAATPAAGGADMLMEMGRRAFPDVDGVVLYALSPVPPAEGQPPLPDVVAAITLKDPAKVQGYWYPMLGMASVAAGGSSKEGTPLEIDGTPARSFSFGNMTLYTATVGNQFYMGSTPSALKRTLDPRRAGKSVLDDPAFAPSLARLGPGTTLVFFVDAGRAMGMARIFMPPAEAAGIEPYLGLFSRMSSALTLDLTDHLMSLTSTVTGLPDISGVIMKALAEERERESRDQAIDAAVEAEQWDQALTLLDQRLANDPDDDDALMRKFKVLAVHKKDMAGATAAAQPLAKSMWEDAKALNNLAWALLTEERYGKNFNAVALEMARRANELTGMKNWLFLDTLAVAEFEAGNPAKAAELEEMAIERYMAGREDLATLQKSLQKFRESASK
ncbi:MAG: hypothetical protein KA419_08505 [Acidobacteria bacterium]|nr:hypothetical protein [Acidobacteriota bacterium]